MSPVTRALIARFRRKASTLEPGLRRAWFRGFDQLERELSESALMRVLQSGGVEQLLDEKLSTEIVEQAFAAYRQGLREEVRSAAETFVKDLPRPAQPGIAFDVLSPKTVEGLRTLESRVMVGLTDEIRQVVRQHVQGGLEAGEGPRAIARGLREVLRLAPNQEAAVRNFRRMLEERDTEALSRALRDRRFDATLRRAFAEGGLSERQITTMTDAYRRKMVAFNAETHARTATLDAMKEGQRLAWDEAADSGLVDRERLRKEWVSVGDDRVRPEHVAMDGEVVPADQVYSNGEMVPGESTYNCRCISRFFLARATA